MGTRNDAEANLWLQIPAADYEGHMGNATVGQLPFLSEVLAQLLHRLRPKRLCVVGCSTGNGFEHIDWSSTERVVAIDINPDYLAILRQRFAPRLGVIETVCGDVGQCPVDHPRFDLIHCALLLEYVDVPAVLRRLAGWLASNGSLSVVLQLHDDGHEPVTPTRFESLAQLAPIMRLVEPAELRDAAAAVALWPQREGVRQLPSGKRFYLANYRSA